MADFTKFNGYNVKDAGAGRSLSVSGSDLSLKDANGNTLSIVQMSGGGGGVNKYSDLTDVDLIDPIIAGQIPFYNGSPDNNWSQFCVEPVDEIHLELLRIIHYENNTPVLDLDLTTGATSFTFASNVSYTLIWGIKSDTLYNHARPIAKFARQGTAGGDVLSLLPYIEEVHTRPTAIGNESVFSKRVYKVPNMPLMRGAFGGYNTSVNIKSPFFLYETNDVGTINEYYTINSTNVGKKLYPKNNLNIHFDKYPINDTICCFAISDCQPNAVVSNLDKVKIMIPIYGYCVGTGGSVFTPSLLADVDENDKLYINETYLAADINDYLNIT